MGGGIVKRTLLHGDHRAQHSWILTESIIICSPNGYGWLEYLHDQPRLQKVRLGKHTLWRLLPCPSCDCMRCGGPWALRCWDYAPWLGNPRTTRTFEWKQDLQMGDFSLPYLMNRGEENQTLNGWRFMEVSLISFCTIEMGWWPHWYF